MTVHTAEVQCSIAECCCSWAWSASSPAEAQQALDSAMREQGAVRARIGIIDADGHAVEIVLCRLCADGLRASLA